MLGNGDPVRDFSDVRDVVRAYALLVDRGTPGETYNVCSGRGVSVGDLAAELVARSSRPLRLATDGALGATGRRAGHGGRPGQADRRHRVVAGARPRSDPRRRARGGAGYGRLTSTGVPLGTCRASHPRSVAMARGS